MSSAKSMRGWRTATLEAVNVRVIIYLLLKASLQSGICLLVPSHYGSNYILVLSIPHMIVSPPPYALFYISVSDRNVIIQRFYRKMLTVMVKIATFPYYRLFHFNTLRPIELIASYTRLSMEPDVLIFLIDRWKRHKRAELQFVSLAAAIVAAAVIGSFSWNAVSDSYWLASAFWYCSLVLSILAILLSAQQISVLDLLDAHQNEGKTTPSRRAIRRYLPLMLTEMPRERDPALDDEGSVGHWRPRWKMVFTWQCSIMFLSYSVCSYLAGLTIFVCTPLIRRQLWSTSSNTAVIYLVTSGIAGAVFMFCSFWVYHYVDLEDDLEDFSAQNAEASWKDYRRMPNLNRDSR